MADAMAQADVYRLAQHYIWKDVAARATPLGIPTALLAVLAERTQDRVPADLTDPIARVEWHIEYILGLAREHLGERAAKPRALLAVCLAARVPAMLYQREARTIAHQALTVTQRDVPAGQIEAGPECLTSLPAAVCACGRYLLIGE